MATPLVSIFTKTLVKAGRQGLPVGELQQHLAIPASTLSHHLSSLISVSLVRRERQGRTLFCHACYDNLAALIAFLTEECCADEYAPPGFYVTTGEKNDC
uniref:Arsenical resistance operon repressor n=1 Tax=Klebsiella pneumoniae TaxID=573 RepID=A0A8B0STR7_KLEPN|nr:Arsenical resistance operon repressor [Klebsiella pneumoniae]